MDNNLTTFNRNQQFKTTNSNEPTVGREVLLITRSANLANTHPSGMRRIITVECRV